MTSTSVPELVPHVPQGLEIGLRNYWYPILQSEELPQVRPIGLRCLGEGLVVWRDADGRPGVARDRCPHRSARLSLGRVLDGALQCAFHGLRFDRDGRCVLLPWEPEESPRPGGICVQAYPARELGGYIWAYLGDRERLPPPPLEDEVPEELLHSEEYLWFRMPTEVWDANWLLTVDGSDAYHAVTLHADTQAVADKPWAGGRAEHVTIPLADRRMRFVRGSYGLRAISTDRAGTPIHHGHLLEVKGDRFVLPAITTTPIQAVPGAEPYVPRLWQFPIDAEHTMIVRYVAQPARDAEARERWERLFLQVVRPRLEGVSREDAAIAAAQGDLVTARTHEHLLEPDADMFKIRLRLEQAFVAQADGQRIAPAPGSLVYPV